MRTLVLGIDSGTQSTKALVVDSRNGAVLGTAAQGYDLIPNLPAGAKEQHPHTWRDATAKAIRQALRQARVRARAAGARQPELLARIDVAESGTRIRQGRWGEARDLAGHAVTLLEAALVGDDVSGSSVGRSPSVTRTSSAILAKAYLYSDIASGELLGDAEVTHLDDALRIYNELGDFLGQSKEVADELSHFSSELINLIVRERRA